MIRLVVIFLIVAGVLATGGYLYLEQPKFGRLPNKSLLKEFDSSPNFIEGEFRNKEPITLLASSSEKKSGWIEFLFSSDGNRTPPGPVPTIKTDLRALERNQDLIVWLGHSSYFIQLAGKTILLDPVLSESASPVPFRRPGRCCPRAPRIRGHPRRHQWWSGCAPLRSCRSAP